MKKPTVDEICALYAERGAKITVKPLPRHPKTLLIEGDQRAFEFLGELFLAHSRGVNDCGFEIGPRNPGGALFSKKATLSLYLHRLPCDSDSE